VHFYREHRSQLFLFFLFETSVSIGMPQGTISFVKERKRNIPLSYKNPTELPACAARIYTRRLVATNETDIRTVPVGHSAGLATQTFRHANKRENSGKKGADREGRGECDPRT